MGGNELVAPVVLLLFIDNDVHLQLSSTATIEADADVFRIKNCVFLYFA